MRTRSRIPTSRGFTLVEILIVVAIIGLLAVIALPAIAKARRIAQNKAFINDLRIATAAFEQYAISHGSYPPDVTPSVMPSGMSTYLENMRWTGRTPVGGQWDWDYMQFGNKIGVSVYFGNNSQNERMREIDAAIDDGNLASGAFRSRSQGYICIIEQR